MFYRAATANDIGVLAELRKKQLIDEGIVPDSDIDNELIDFFTKKLNDNSLVEWVGIENNMVVATAAIVFYYFPPTYANKSGIKGYITNMYTAPKYRGQGIATVLLGKLVLEAKKRNVKKYGLEHRKWAVLFI